MKRLDNTTILSGSQKDILDRLKYPFSRVRQDRKLLEHQEFEFVYVSAKTEGNTYTRGEALVLLDRGLTAGGKPLYDAKMLENLKRAFELFVLDPQPITKDLIKEIHYVLNDGLLEKNRLGIFRDGEVSIGGTDYRPPVGQKYIDAEIEYLLKKAREIENPFEKAIYLHCNFAYIQPFYDGNKRTARTLQAIVLADEDITPLVSKEKWISDYLDALIDYYERGDYGKYVEFFIRSFTAQHEYLSHFFEPKPTEVVRRIKR